MNLGYMFDVEFLRFEEAQITLVVVFVNRCRSMLDLVDTENQTSPLDQFLAGEVYTTLLTITLSYAMRFEWDHLILMVPSKLENQF